MKTAIIISARYGSTRLPGKPLKKIAGQEMLSRVVDIARAVQKNDTANIDVLVATDDQRITDFCDQINVKSLMTSVDCPTGSDRALEAMHKLPYKPDFVVNFQGDAPLTPPDFIEALIEGFKADPKKIDVITPVTQLTWDGLDKLRKSKEQTPFSGTCAILKENHDAIWFSKHIIPAIRKEEQWRAKGEFSPVYRHVGIYGYSPKMLATYVTLEQGYYEQLEGLEQLRVLENGYTIRAVKVDYAGRASMSGVDSPEDVTRAEALIDTHGELLGTDTTSHAA